MIVYCFANKVNCRSYVGITILSIEERWYKHVTAVRNGSEYHFHRALRKHGVDAFEHVILEECASIEELKIAERRWIWLLATNKPAYGYNMTLGGDGVFGLQMTEETRQRMCEAKLGTKQTEEHRRKISEAMKRRYTDPAAREQTRASLMVPEIRRKMSENGKGKHLRRSLNIEQNKGMI